MMERNDFSVIVQGPILSSPDRPGERDLTIRCLASIRAFFPGAEIVLSTWQKENTDDLDYDLLVKSEDPGRSLTTTGETLPVPITPTAKSSRPGPVSPPPPARMR